MKQEPVPVFPYDWGYTEVVKLRAISEGRPLRHVGNAHRKV